MSRLGVSEGPADMIRFGHNTMDTLVPPEQDRDNFSLLPSVCSVKGEVKGTGLHRSVGGEGMCMIFKAIKADPPTLSTGILFGENEISLADPYGVASARLGIWMTSPGYSSLRHCAVGFRALRRVHFRENQRIGS